MVAVPLLVHASDFVVTSYEALVVTFVLFAVATVAQSLLKLLFVKSILMLSAYNISAAGPTFTYLIFSATSLVVF